MLDSLEERVPRLTFFDVESFKIVTRLEAGSTRETLHRITAECNSGNGT